MAQVSSYSLLFYGSPSGYQTNRAQIQLSDSSGKTLAWVRFNDAGMLFEDDYVRADRDLRSFRRGSLGPMQPPRGCPRLSRPLDCDHHPLSGRPHDEYGPARGNRR